MSRELATNQSADRSSVMNVQGAPDAASFLPGPFLRWFASRGWAPREHQLELLRRRRYGWPTAGADLDRGIPAELGGTERWTARR